MAPLEQLVRDLPKAELHLHIEGTLEPDLMMEMADRNQIELPYATVEEARSAYVFEDLQSFLDIYYAGCAVLLTEQDFYDLTSAYLTRARAQGVRHVEIFFDPQTHTQRGVRFETVVTGIHRALQDGGAALEVSSRLIMCFLRHLSAKAAMETLRQAGPFAHVIHAVGLDSAEVGNPPSKFTEVFDAARGMGLPAVAHAGEEGPPSYIWEALDLLHVRRIDHGVRCLEDARLTARLAHEQVPLTVCPLSNARLQVFPSLEDHNLPSLLHQGLLVTINSDDPAYFGGYVGDNFLAVANAFDLDGDTLAQLARNSFAASFLDEEDRAQHLAAIDRVMAEG